MNKYDIHDLIMEKKLKQFTGRQLWNIDPEHISFVKLRPKLKSLVKAGVLTEVALMQNNIRYYQYTVVEV